MTLNCSKVFTFYHAFIIHECMAKDKNIKNRRTKTTTYKETLEELRTILTKIETNEELSERFNHILDSIENEFEKLDKKFYKGYEVYEENYGKVVIAPCGCDVCVENGVQPGHYMCEGGTPELDNDPNIIRAFNDKWEYMLI